MFQFMARLARSFAILGGTVLSLLIIQTCLSVAGRSINTLLHSEFVQGAVPSIASALLATGIGPINGAFELVEAGMAFVVFAFLPLCQLHGSHAAVDIFTSRLPTRLQAYLRTGIEVVFALVIVIIARELGEGMVSKYKSGQTTFILQFPLWWAYGLSLVAAVASAIVATYVAAVRLYEVATGRIILPEIWEAQQ